MRVELQVKSGHLKWAKKEQGSEEIDLQELFDEYWTSKAHELPVRGQSESPISSLIVDREAQRTLLPGNIVTRWNYNSLQKSTFVLWQFPIACRLQRSLRRIRYAPRSKNSKGC